MKKIYSLGLIAIALVLTTTMLFSQDSSAIEACDGENTQSIGLYPVNNIGFAYERKIDANRSWRFYLDLDGGISNTERENKSFYQSPGDTGRTRLTGLSDNKDFGIELSGLHIWRVYTKGKFDLVTGIGPLLAIDRYSNSYDQKSYDSDGNLSRTYNSSSDGFSYGLGILGLFGAGYHLTCDFTLYGEYRLKYIHLWTDGTEIRKEYYSSSGNEYINDTDISITTDDFYLSNVLVGIYYTF